MLRSVLLVVSGVFFSVYFFAVSTVLSLDCPEEVDVVLLVDEGALERQQQKNDFKQLTINFSK